MKKALAALIIAAAASTAMVAPSAAAPLNAKHAAPVVAGDVITIDHRRAERGRSILPPRAIYRKLHRMGFRDIGPIHMHRGNYVTRAQGYRGTVRLVVDARSGQIIHKRVLRPVRHHYQRPGVTFGGGQGNFSWSLTLR